MYELKSGIVIKIKIWNGNEMARWHNGIVSDLRLRVRVFDSQLSG